MNAKVWICTIACFLIVSSGLACKPGSGGVAEMDGMTAADVINYAMETSCNTEKFFMDTIVRVEKEEFMTMSSQGAIDYPHEKMYMISEYSVDMFGVPITEKIDIYIIGDWMYTGTNSGYGIDWCKEELDEGEGWDEYDVTSSNLELIEQFAEARFLEAETILGIDCYKIDVTPSSYILGAWAAEQADIDSMDDFSMILWIAKETYYVMQMEIDMTVAIEGISGSIYMLTTSYGFDQPVYISLPAGAADAYECYDYDWY